ncbi:helix-turn-helix domain-containing protein [Patescibacteria group bacterium]|nr:helix-turn-helix domain-containing protein [Patescibacteria group bacterium]
MTTVGEIIKKRRLEKGFTLLDVEKRIRIREKYLRAIEDNNWNFFSSKIYIIGILKNYSKLLAIDENKILAFFRRDYERKEDIRFKEKVSRKYLAPETKQVLRGGLVIIVLFFFFYFCYQLFLFLTPPKLTILSPKDRVFNREDKVEIVGKTDKEASIVIIGQRVYQDNNGIFKYEFPIKEGNNVLKIELTGANGKKSVYKENFVKKESR